MAIDIKLEADGADSIAIGSNSVSQVYLNGEALISINTKPVITRIGLATIVITEGDTYIDEGATATDAEDGNITADIVTVNPVDPDTVGNYTVTYNVTDSEGLAADEVTRAVEVEAAVAVTESTILYTLEDALTGSIAQYYIPNLGVGSVTYDGKLEYVGDGTEAEGNPFDPGALYPLDGTIDLEAQADGKGSTQINTQLAAGSDRLRQVAYDIIPGVSYKMYALHEVVGAYDIYMGDSVNGYPVTPTYENVLYDPGTGTLKITSELPDVIPTPTFSKAYISFNSENTAQYPTPNGEAVNNGGTSGNTSLINLVNSEGINDGWTYQNSIAFPGGGSNAITTVSEHETNDGFHFDAMMDAMATMDGSQSEIHVPAGTYTLTFTAGTTLTGDRKLGVTVDGGTQQILDVVNNYFDGLTFTDIVSDGVNPIVVDYASTGEENGYLSSLVIERTA